MRELTVKVSDSQFDTLVSFLGTLPYVQLPPSLKKKNDKAQIIEKASSPGKLNSKKKPFDFASLGSIDLTPLDKNDVKANHSINWENFQEVIEFFKDIPLENYIEQHTELHND